MLIVVFQKPQDVLTVGEEVDAQITNIDFDSKRVSLSIRALLPEEEIVEEVEAVEETAAEVVEEVAEPVVEETVESVAE